MGLILMIVLVLAPVWAVAQDSQPAQAAQGIAIIRVAPETVVDAERVLLHHIAELSGFSAAQRDQVGGIYIGYAPRPSESNTYTGERLRKLVASYNINARVEIPEQVRITRGHRIIAKERIRELFLDALVRQSGVDPSKVKVPSVNPDADLIVPSGNSRISVEFSAGETFRRRATARLSIIVNNRHWKSIYLTGVIEIYGQVVKVARDIPRGQQIGIDDVTVEEADFGTLPDSVVTELGDVLGMETLTALKAGQVLTETLVQAPVLVARGDMVTLVLDIPNMRVTARGIAQQNGRRRQVIKVLNIASNKVVYGQVLTTNEVKIQF
jgi:flagella basal body P-ring formation protein FlgA